MSGPLEQKPSPGFRARLHEIIFESDTPAGRAFDVALLFAILISVGAVMLESIPDMRARHGATLRAIEWLFTILFSIEYVLRLIAVKRPLQYARSFFGLVDLLTVIPTYVSALVPGIHTLLVIRVVRLLRVFRILKLGSFLGQAEVLMMALRASRQKITVFLCSVLAVIVVAGAVMYLIEGPAHGFDSIPRSMYWAIVTMTTVGYGDISPRTPLGQLFASMLMIVGYGIIAVPTGIVSVELANAARHVSVSAQACPSCGKEGHDVDARYCKFCGSGM